ncbi:MAG TPA: hypothetical protein VF789_04330 [Thermoanaerobaculia bacterium]
MAKRDGKVRVLITIDDEHLNDIDRLVKACEKAGLEVESSLESIGTITGAIDPDKLDELSRVPGVAGVEREGEYDVGPPDSDLQ